MIANDPSAFVRLRNAAGVGHAGKETVGASVRELNRAAGAMDCGRQADLENRGIHVRSGTC
jgi:hypothetical protein